MGEGGGQVLRTSLGLSLVTGQPFRIENIRAGRPKPGLMRQHLTAVRAAAQVSGAAVSGDAVGSRELAFAPGPVRPGAYEFAVGTAGSATLVFQTLLPALMIADAPSQLMLQGGTHNPGSPPFDFLAKAFLPLLGRMGPRLTAELIRPGFYPAGGGELRVSITPSPSLRPLELTQRGEILARRARAIVARLPDHIAQRELAVVEQKLGWTSEALAAERMDSSLGPGNILLLEIESRHVTEVFCAFGEIHTRAEAVAAKAVEEAQDYLSAGVPVGAHMADQLLVPLALSAFQGGGGRFVTLRPTRHTRTNIDVIQKFMNVKITIAQLQQNTRAWEIDVRPL